MCSSNSTHTSRLLIHDAQNHVEYWRRIKVKLDNNVYSVFSNDVLLKK